MKTPISDHAIAEYLPPFTRELHERVRAGSKNYGDSSFKRCLKDLVEETKQECVDIPGWSFLLWTKLEKLLELIEAIERITPSKCEKHNFAGDGKPKTMCAKCWKIYAIRQLQNDLGLNGPDAS